MEKKVHVMFTAGRGPIECSLAVKGVQAQFKKHLHKHGVDFKVSAQKLGSIPQSMESIVFEITNVNQKLLTPWLGTIQWVCKSPIRKYHKRKNWFLKCMQLTISSSSTFKKPDVQIQYYRASGPGGQHRNKVETAVRLFHPASGITVTASEARSQLQNNKMAWEKLELAFRERQKQNFSQFDFEKWNAQIEIERGKAVKVFEGPKFRVRK